MSRGGRFLGALVIVAATALLACPSFVAQSAGAAQTGLNGTWQCCGAGGAASQVFVMSDGTGTAETSVSGGEFATITDSDNGGQVKITTTYTGSTYVATFIGTLASDDQSMSGTWTSNAGQSGTWSAVRTSATASELNVSVTLSSLEFDVGKTVQATVTVTAGSSDLSNVSLGTGLIVAGGYAKITQSPASLSLASLSAGTSQTFVFLLQGVKDGGDLVSVDVSGTAASGSVSGDAQSKYDVGSFDVTPPFSGKTGGALPAAAPIASTLGTPGQVFHNMGHNLVNAGITVVAILFITFPANMFNNTFSSNYAEILLILAGWRRRLRRAFGLKEKPSSDDGSTSQLPAMAKDADAPGASSRTWFVGVLAIGAILGGLLNPHFGFNGESVSGFGATLVSFAIGATLSWYITKLFRERHQYPTHTYLKALPLGLGVAALCVLISRLTSFEPGYLYGVVVSIAFVESLEERHNAHLTVISTFSTLAVAVLAWFAWIPVNHFAMNHAGDIPLGVLDDVLGSIFVGGLVGTVVGLMPLEFMPGGALLKWRKDVWAVVFFVALFLLVSVELNPASGPTHHGSAPVVTAIVLFVLFGGGTWLMRRYFVKRMAAKAPVLALASAPAAIGSGVADEPVRDVAPASGEEHTGGDGDPSES